MKNEKLKEMGTSQARKQKLDLPDRVLDFVVSVVKLTSTISRSSSGNHISLQLVRSATSTGANYEEACAAQSKNDFIHKIQVALKECRETVYWLKLCERLQIADTAKSTGVKAEGQEILLILAKSVVTSKGLT